MSSTYTKAAIVAALAALFLFAAPSPDATAAEQYVLKFGTLAPNGTPWSKLLQQFRQRIEKESKGRIKVKLYLNGAQGDERRMLEKIRFNQLTGGGFTTAGMRSVESSLQLLEAPFLFRNYKEVDHVLDKVIFEDMKKSLAKHGLYLYVWAENGWVDFGNNVKPLRTPGDFAGIKWFAQEADVHIKAYQALGGQGRPLPVPDVLNALQTGLVTGFGTTPIFATAAQWYTQAKYWTDSDHIYQPAAVVISLKFWNSLPDDLKKLIEDIGPGLRDAARRDVRGLDKGLFKGFKKSGIAIEKMPDDLRKQLIKKTSKVPDELVKEGIVPAALLKKVRDALAKMR